MRGLRSLRAHARGGASSGGDGKVLGNLAVNLPPRLWLVLAACVVCIVGHSSRADGRGGGVPSVKPAPPSPALLAKAKDVYVDQCAVCHGETGGGDGLAAYLLYPKPRNFRDAYFRLTSTDNRVPTDADLHRTITRGIPGSSMTSWQHLEDDVRWGLAYLVRDLWREGLKASFQGEDLEDDEAAELITELTSAGEPIAVPPVQADSPETRAAGRKLYEKSCQSCHGPEGRGDGTEIQVTVEGYPISPADYTQGLFKGGSAPEQLYRRIIKGMAGTPMPESDLTPEQLWPLVHYIGSLAKPGAEEAALQGRTTIVARRVNGKLSDDPQDFVWSQAVPQFISLRPLWWRKQRIDAVRVQALHNAEEIALLLSWEDSSADRDALATAQFGDGVAVQFSLDDDPPFFGMGSAAKPVNIWHWKAVWQQDALARRDVEQRHPAMVADYYQEESADGIAKRLEGVPSSKTLPATCLTGRVAGNALSASDHPSAVEDLNARALGTLSAQPRISQDVVGTGVWKKGVWQVVLRRPLKTKDRWDVNFDSGIDARIAFAVWDGSAGDRDGQKSVSIWHNLELSAGGKP